MAARVKLSRTRSSPRRAGLLALAVAASIILFFYGRSDEPTLAARSRAKLRAARVAVTSRRADELRSPSIDVEDADDEYRRRLAAHAPFPPLEPRATLGFSHIYVLSLPGRKDRQERMRKLARALGLEFTFVDATYANAPVVTFIGERAAEVRRMKRALLAEAYGVPETHVGGMQIGSMWLEPSLEMAAPSKPDDPLTGLRMTATSQIDWPSLARSEYGGLDWVEFLETAPLSKLVPRDPHFNVTEAMWDPLESHHFRQMNDAVHATWYSQTRVLEQMRRNDDDMALVLEDDVDMEWDIQRTWPTILRRLPKGDGPEPAWQQVYLGHCWGRELTKPAYMHPYLHPSSEPRCLHAYALTRAGYTELLRILRDPWFAYQTAIDTAIPRLIRDERLQSFSVDPPLIIQAKDTPSDIQSGSGSPWRGHLADSTFDRIWRAEGLEVPDLSWADAQLDPASKMNRMTAEKTVADREALVRGHVAEHHAAQRAAKILDAAQARDARQRARARPLVI